MVEPSGAPQPGKLEGTMSEKEEREQMGQSSSAQEDIANANKGLAGAFKELSETVLAPWQGLKEFAKEFEQDCRESRKEPEDALVDPEERKEGQPDAD